MRVTGEHGCAWTHMGACCRIENYDEYLIYGHEAPHRGIRAVGVALSAPLVCEM